MKINLTGNSSDSKFTPKVLTEGTQEARVSRIIDLGVQPPMNTKFGTDPKRQLLVQFELADDTVEIKGETKPAFIGARINFVGGEKSKLTALVRACGVDSDSVELKDILGSALSVTIKNRESNGNTYSNVVSFAPISARVAKTVPELVADSYIFSFDDPDVEIASKLGKGMRRVLEKAINYPGSEVEKLLGESQNETKSDDSGSEDVI